MVLLLPHAQQAGRPKPRRGPAWRPTGERAAGAWQALTAGSPSWLRQLALFVVHGGHARLERPSAPWAPPIPARACRQRSVHAATSSVNMQPPTNNTHPSRASPLGHVPDHPESPATPRRSLRLLGRSPGLEDGAHAWPGSSTPPAKSPKCDARSSPRKTGVEASPASATRASAAAAPGSGRQGLQGMHPLLRLLTGEPFGPCAEVGYEPTAARPARAVDCVYGCDSMCPD